MCLLSLDLPHRYWKAKHHNTGLNKHLRRTQAFSQGLGVAGEATSMLVLAHLVDGQQFVGPYARLLSSAPCIEASMHLLVRDY